MTSAPDPTEPTDDAGYAPARYVVIGAGAVGASVAAELHRAGVETVLVARGAHLAVLRALAALREEAGMVYAAAGITPVHRPPEDFRVAEIAGHARAGNSTWQSLARAGTTEIDFLSGEIALLGRLHGVHTPANTAVQARVHRAVSEGTKPGSLGDADLVATLPGLAAAVPVAAGETPA